MTDTERQLQRMLDERGYIVVASTGSHPAGFVLDGDDSCEKEVSPDGPLPSLVVVRETDLSDYNEQARLLGKQQFEYLPLTLCINFYRVVAE